MAIIALSPKCILRSSLYVSGRRNTPVYMYRDRCISLDTDTDLYTPFFSCHVYLYQGRTRLQLQCPLYSRRVLPASALARCVLCMSSIPMPGRSGIRLSRHDCIPGSVVHYDVGASCPASCGGILSLRMSMMSCCCMTPCREVTWCSLPSNGRCRAHAPTLTCIRFGLWNR